jgi:hypothetical protein
MSKNTDLSELINYVKGISSGRLTFPFYTTTTSFTGTVAGYLAFDSSGNILTTTSPSTQWTTSGANIYYNTGNVGINNASPAYKLDVAGDINITGAFRINGTSIGTGGSGGVSGSGTANYHTKWSGATSLTNGVIYDDGTNISIGSTSPLYKLTVQPVSNVNFGIGYASILGTNDGVFVNAVNNSFISVPMAINSQHLGFFIGFSEAMRITSSKIIMINTTAGISGGGQLQVNGDVNISGTFKVNGTAIGTGGGGTGNINGSGTSGYVSMFTAGTTIGTSSIYSDPYGSSYMSTSFALANNSVNIGYISFASSATETGTMIMNIKKLVGTVYNDGTLLMQSTRVKVSNRLSIGDLTTASLAVGDLYADSNGFIKVATSAT